MATLSYVSNVPEQVVLQTRAIMCRGYVVGPSSEALAEDLYAWTCANDGGLGDMSLQLVAHGEDLASSGWSESPFIVGVLLREVFGLHGDHRLGISNDELWRRCDEADRRLDGLCESLTEVAARHGASLTVRALYLSWSGPLCSAHLVKGAWRDTADDHEYWWSVEDGEPAFYFSREGASGDQAPGGAFGFLIAQGEFDNSDPPVVLTRELIESADPALVALGIEPRLFVFSMYD